jgi:hypothetical protein
METELKTIKERLEDHLLGAGVGLNSRILFDDMRITVCDQSSGERLDERLLLASGVTRSTLDNVQSAEQAQALCGYSSRLRRRT